MSKSICLYFQVHQPTRLRLYRFFDIGKDSHYYDDFANRTILRRVADKCYLPMNKLLLEEIQKSGGKLKVAFSISGSALEQFSRYAPDVLDSFRALADTGKVEFLAETYYHSLAALASPAEFRRQVEKHKAAIESNFGVTPTTFRNTELIYSNSIGEQVYELGFRTMLTEGARHVMAEKSPNYVYANQKKSSLKLLLRNYSLSDDIAFRFSDRGWSNWPLTAEKYLSWVKDSEGDIVNLFMDYETFGEHQKAESGVFDFMRSFVEGVVSDGALKFVSPSEAVKAHKTVGLLDVEDPISWADEERDLTAWLGNELQQDAYNKLYAQYEKVALLNDDALWNDFGHLQESDHLYYMCTKFFSDGFVHKYFNPYDTPYESFINYMNVLSDFIVRVDDAISVSNVNFAAGRKTSVSAAKSKGADEAAAVKPEARKKAASVRKTSPRKSVKKNGK